MRSVCFLQIHFSKQGQLFKSQVQSMHKEILQSPWLCELMAFHINLRETKVNSMKSPAFFDECSLTFKEGKPSLTCELFDAIKIDIDLTCSICLVSYWISNCMNSTSTIVHYSHSDFSFGLHILCDCSSLFYRLMLLIWLFHDRIRCLIRFLWPAAIYSVISVLARLHRYLLSMDLRQQILKRSVLYAER